MPYQSFYFICGSVLYGIIYNINLSQYLREREDDRRLTSSERKISHFYPPTICLTNQWCLFSDQNETSPKACCVIFIVRSVALFFSLGGANVFVYRSYLLVNAIFCCLCVIDLSFQVMCGAEFCLTVNGNLDGIHSQNLSKHF